MLTRTQSVDDAELDHRVAYADAYDAYEAALAKASRDLLAAVDRADRTLAMAKANQRSAELAVANIRAYYGARADGLLVEDLRRFEYMISPAYGVHRDRSLDGQVRTHIDLISAEVARRGLDVS